jgi:hypothetical protein
MPRRPISANLTPHSRLTDERNLSPILETSREDESLDHSKLSCAPANDDVGTEELPRLDTTDPCSDGNIALYVYVMQCRPAACVCPSALTVVAGPQVHGCDRAGPQPHVGLLLVRGTARAACLAGKERRPHQLG